MESVRVDGLSPIVFIDRLDYKGLPKYNDPLRVYGRTYTMTVVVPSRRNVVMSERDDRGESDSQ
jgi:hypothetical protein